MTTQFRIEKTDSPDGALIAVGPTDPETNRQLTIPVSFERELIDEGNGLRVTLTCRFTNNKVEVTRLTVLSMKNEYISSRSLAQLGLPAMIHAITMKVIPNVDYWETSKTAFTGLDASKQNYIYLAQIYWLEHISSGAPRQTLMNLLHMPRSSCNVLLRNIKREIELPKTN